MQDLRRSFCALERHPSLRGLVVSAAGSGSFDKVKLTKEKVKDGGILDLTSPVGTLKAFLGVEGVDGGFPDGTGGGGLVFDLGAGDKRKDCDFRCWGHSG